MVSRTSQGPSLPYGLRGAAWPLGRWSSAQGVGIAGLSLRMERPRPRQNSRKGVQPFAAPTPEPHPGSNQGETRGWLKGHCTGSKGDGGYPELWWPLGRWDQSPCFPDSPTWYRLVPQQNIWFPGPVALKNANIVPVCSQLQVCEHSVPSHVHCPDGQPGCLVSVCPVTAPPPGLWVGNWFGAWAPKNPWEGLELGGSACEGPSCPLGGHGQRPVPAACLLPPGRPSRKQMDRQHSLALGHPACRTRAGTETK